jgi:hypothetical protein
MDTWPDGRKESVNSLNSDDNVTNGIDRVLCYSCK